MTLDDLTKTGGRPEDSMAQAAAPPRRDVTPLAALVLSLLVLPGLGQMLTGRKIRGAIMAGLAALWLPAAVIKIGLDLNKVMPELMARAAEGQKLTFEAFQQIMSPMAGGLIWLFLPLAFIWLWALADSLVYVLRSKNVNKDG